MFPLISPWSNLNRSKFYVFLSLSVSIFDFSHSYQTPYSPERTNEAPLRRRLKEPDRFGSVPRKECSPDREIPLTSGCTFVSIRMFQKLTEDPKRKL